MTFLPLACALAPLALPHIVEGDYSPTTYSPTTTACSAFPTKVSPDIYYAIHEDTPTELATNSTNELILYQGAGVTHQIDTIVSFPTISCPAGPYNCDYYLVFDWLAIAPYNWVFGYNNTLIDVFYFGPVPMSNGAATLTWENAAALTLAKLGSFNLPGYEPPRYQLTYVSGIGCESNLELRLSITNTSSEAGDMTYQGGGANGGLQIYHGAAYPT